MAVDEALFCCFDPERSLPVLRLYGWSPPALSLGRYQSAADTLKLSLCAADGVAVVRRMTGGGIIYHACELTYSLVCTPEQIGEAGVKEGFRTLCGFLTGAYRALGLNARFAFEAKAPEERLGVRTAFCFAGKEECDIVIDGRKLGGNAQRRTRGMILQHGSIPLRNEVAQGVRYLRDAAPGAEAAASLSDFGVMVEPDQLKRLLFQAFEKAMGARLVSSELSDAEQAMAKRLRQEKYAQDFWNLEAGGR